MCPVFLVVLNRRSGSNHQDCHSGKSLGIKLLHYTVFLSIKVNYAYCKNFKIKFKTVTSLSLPYLLILFPIPGLLPKKTTFVDLMYALSLVSL